jgi:hypothetical protein
MVRTDCRELSTPPAGFEPVTICFQDHSKMLRELWGEAHVKNHCAGLRAPCRSKSKLQLATAGFREKNKKRKSATWGAAHRFLPTDSPSGRAAHDIDRRAGKEFSQLADLEDHSGRICIDMPPRCHISAAGFLVQTSGPRNDGLWGP